MLGPHDTENAKFREVWLAAEYVLDPFEFFGGEIMLVEYFGGDRCFGGHQSTFRSENETEILSFLAGKVETEETAEKSTSLLFINYAVFHHKGNRFHSFNIGERVTLNGNDIGVFPSL
jgi:hypothetical protein